MPPRRTSGHSTVGVADCVAQALRQAGPNRREPLRARDVAQNAAVEHPQADENRQVADRVDAEVDGHPEGSDRHARNGGADDARQVEAGRVERDRVDEVLGRDELGGERLAHRHLDGVHEARREGQDVDMPDLDDARGRQDEQRRGLEHGDRVDGHQCPPLVDAIGQHAADRRQDHGRGEHERQHQAQLERRATELKHEPGLSDRLHPGTGQAADLAEPVDPVVSMAHGRESATDAARRTRRRRRPWRAALGAPKQVRDRHSLAMLTTFGTSCNCRVTKSGCDGRCFWAMM